MNNPIVYFCIGVAMFLTYAMASNDPAHSGNTHRCTGECYENYLAQNGTIVEREAQKRELRAKASPADLGKVYYAQCIGCHGANGEGSVGPKLAGQAASDIVSKLSAYRAGETLGNQSMLMWSVSKPMTDIDIDNLGAYVATMK